MASEFEYEVTEWWDREGGHHAYSPIEEQLLNDAAEVTAHITYYDENGNQTGEKYVDISIPEDGATWDELEGDIEDAANFYEES